MKIVRILLILPSLLFGINIRIALGQSVTAQNASASSALAQLSAAISGGKQINTVQLIGNATWKVGSLHDSGTVQLSASVNGSSQMQLALSASGERTESQSAIGLNTVCQWSGADGIVHQIDAENCWKPAVWFFPAISLQPAQLTNELIITDLGTGLVGSSETTYRHLRGNFAFKELPSSLSADIEKQSVMDIGLDPVSMLPILLSYSVRPDRGDSNPIAIEIRYSDYREIDGVQIPFEIQRYVNGSLQLAITVSSAQID